MNDKDRIKMQLSVSCPDFGFPDTKFTATEKSLVADAVKTLADEWGTNIDVIILSYEGNELPNESLLMSHGVVCDSELVARLSRNYGKSWFTEPDKITQLLQHYHAKGSAAINIDSDSFIEGGSVAFYTVWMPKEIKNISFKKNNNTTTFRSVGDDFLYRSEIERLSVPGFCDVINIGNWFLLGCTSLTELDISGLNKVTSIGDSFLIHATSLLKLDLSPLSNLISIGNSFLSGSSLVELDLSVLNNVTTIGANFLSNCESLISVQLSGLCNVERIGNGFLSGCKFLKKIDLSAFVEITSVKNNFLYDCRSLTEVDLSDCINIGNTERVNSAIGDDFLRSCASLVVVKMPQINNKIFIGNNFMNDCTSIKELDLSNLRNISGVGDCFLKSCDKLRTVILPKFSQNSSIGNCFLLKCSSVASIDLSGLEGVTSLKSFFLGGCTSLKNVDYVSLVNVTEVESNFGSKSGLNEDEVKNFLRNISERKSPKKKTSRRQQFGKLFSCFHFKE